MPIWCAAPYMVLSLIGVPMVGTRIMVDYSRLPLRFVAFTVSNDSGGSILTVCRSRDGQPVGAARSCVTGTLTSGEIGADDVLLCSGAESI